MILDILDNLICKTNKLNKYLLLRLLVYLGGGNISGYVNLAKDRLTLTMEDLYFEPSFNFKNITGLKCGKIRKKHFVLLL